MSKDATEVNVQSILEDRVIDPDTIKDDPEIIANFESTDVVIGGERPTWGHRGAKNIIPDNMVLVRKDPLAKFGPPPQAAEDPQQFSYGRVVLFTGLPTFVNEVELRQILQESSSVVRHLRIAEDSAGMSSGAAVVVFSSSETAKAWAEGQKRIVLSTNRALPTTAANQAANSRAHVDCRLLSEEEIRWVSASPATAANSAVPQGVSWLEGGQLPPAASGSLRMHLSKAIGPLGGALGGGWARGGDLWTVLDSLVDWSNLATKPPKAGLADGHHAANPVPQIVNHAPVTQHISSNAPMNANIHGGNSLMHSNNVSHERSASPSANRPGMHQQHSQQPIRGSGSHQAPVGGQQGPMGGNAPSQGAPYRQQQQQPTGRSVTFQQGGHHSQQQQQDDNDNGYYERDRPGASHYTQSGGDRDRDRDGPRGGSGRNSVERDHHHSGGSHSQQRGYHQDNRWEDRGGRGRGYGGDRDHSTGGYRDRERDRDRDAPQGGSRPRDGEIGRRGHYNNNNQGYGSHNGGNQ